MNVIALWRCCHDVVGQKGWKVTKKSDKETCGVYEKLRERMCSLWEKGST